MAATCQGIRKKDGQRCESQVLCDGMFCYVHAPDREQERDAARRRGGHSKANHLRLQKLLPTSLTPVFDQLAQVLADVIADRIDPKNAQAAASVARAMVAVLERGELEERVRRLEQSA